MSGRPEETGGAYDPVPDYARDGWQEFTPWRPGDPSACDEAPRDAAAGSGLAEQSGTLEHEHHTRTSQHADPRAPGRTSGGAGRWWTEDVSRRYATGDRVRTQRAAESGLFSTVQAGSRGQVVSTRRGLFDDHFAMVEFENGYIQEIRTEHLERRGWLD